MADRGAAETNAVGSAPRRRHTQHDEQQRRRTPPPPQQQTHGRRRFVGAGQQHVHEEATDAERTASRLRAYRNFNSIDEATLVSHPTSKFASDKETVMHDSYIDEDTRQARRARQVAGHMPLDWQYFRTMLANERNIMAWTRTFIKLVSLTWTLLKIPTYQAYSFLDSPTDQVLGIVCVATAIWCMHSGIRRYVAWNDTLDFPESHIRGSNNLGWQIYFVMGLMLFLAITLVSRNILDSHFVPHNHEGRPDTTTAGVTVVAPLVGVDGEHQTAHPP